MRSSFLIMNWMSIKRKKNIPKIPCSYLTYIFKIVLLWSILFCLCQACPYFAQLLFNCIWLNITLEERSSKVICLHMVPSEGIQRIHLLCLWKRQPFVSPKTKCVFLNTPSKSVPASPLINYRSVFLSLIYYIGRGGIV